jgi:hypothetical protein
MVATVRPVPGQTDEQFFRDVRDGRAMAGRYKSKEYHEWLERQSDSIGARVQK